MQYSQKNVLNAIRLVFPKVNSEEVLQILNQYKEIQDEKYRVFLAVLKLSCGNKNQLEYFINLAKKDCRDVLFLAEYQNDKLLENPYNDLIS